MRKCNKKLWKNVDTYIYYCIMSVSEESMLACSTNGE